MSEKEVSAGRHSFALLFVIPEAEKDRKDNS
jgi:hypothetical protein